RAGLEQTHQLGVGVRGRQPQGTGKDGGERKAARLDLVLAHCSPCEKTRTAAEDRLHSTDESNETITKINGHPLTYVNSITFGRESIVLHPTEGRLAAPLCLPGRARVSARVRCWWS